MNNSKKKKSKPTRFYATLYDKEGIVISVDAHNWILQIGNQETVYPPTFREVALEVLDSKVKRETRKEFKNLLAVFDKTEKTIRDIVKTIKHVDIVKAMRACRSKEE